MIAELDAELAAINKRMSDIESIDAIASNWLVTHALVKMHAALEVEVRNAVVERCSNTADAARDKFVAGIAERRVRSIAFTELMGILAAFGDQYREALANRFPETDQTRTYYGNIEANRQAVAHGRKTAASWPEIMTWWSAARDVALEFSSVLRSSVSAPTAGV